MRLRAAIAASILICSGTTLPAGEFPYRATINADDVYVRSGPGQDYYATEKLKRGEIVEVYRHDPGGWFAVRPPSASHSYVSARYVRELGGGLLEVTTEGMVARVGSALSAARDVWQVKLRKGEQLEMWDEGPTESGAWYRIAPPAGEFRWVYGRYVDRADGTSFEDELLDPRGSDRDLAPGRDVSLRRSQAREFASEPPLRDRSARPTRAVSYDRQATRAGYDDEVELDQNPRPAPASLRGREPELPPRSIHDAPNAHALELEKIEAELTIAVAREDEIGRLDELLDRAVEVADTARSERDQVRAEDLIERIRRFAALGRQIRRADEQMLLTIQQQQREGRRAAAPARDVPAAAMASADVPNPPFAGDGHDLEAASMELIDSRFDGEGRLVRVTSKRIGAPQYVLLDGDNRVQSYVTAAPGVNLRAYEGRYVGVVGARGYATELKSPHVMAQRVDVLNPRVR